MNEIEYDFMCPYCWQPITMLLDVSVREQRYVEDCEVCCNQIDVHYRVEWGDVVTFEAQQLE